MSLSHASNVVDEAGLRQKKHVFKDRIHAGRELAKKLVTLVRPHVITLAIPAGGVPVGKIVAQELGCAFDVLVVRKIQIPHEPEAGFGALAPDGTVILNDALLRQLRLSQEEISRSIKKTMRDITERVAIFRRKKAFPELSAKTVIVVDDGLASGYTMLAAVNYVKKHAPKRVIVGAPTGSATAVSMLSKSADVIVCLNIRSEPYYAVAEAYETWYDLRDEEVLNYLTR